VSDCSLTLNWQFFIFITFYSTRW